MSSTRTIDGSGNNLEHPTWGKSGETLLRLTTPAYAGRNGPSGSNRPCPKKISDIVCAQSESLENSKGLSDYMWAWGQFLDHEMDLSPEAEPREAFPIMLPRRKKISFFRSAYDPSTGTGIGNARQQVNVLSSFIDGANVYGSNSTRAAILRVFDGSGKLVVDRRNLLPKNPGGLPNAPNSSSKFFIAGDIRANEHCVLTCLHTLFVREHNLVCARLKSDRRFKGQDVTDEEIYQQARRIVSGEMQGITYNEFLPALLGDDALTPYGEYNQEVDPTISNIFSTVAYRLGHSMLSPEVKLDGKGLKPIPFKDLFFRPELVEKRGISPFLGGLAQQRMQNIDTKAVDAVRVFLFKNLPNAPLDLAALNIQRGRDHGLPGYNQCRADFGLSRMESFSQISSNEETCARLKDAYSDVDLIDPWVGGLAEDHHADAAVGELFFHVLKDQFERLRDGDRFWYQNDLALTDKERNDIENTTLSKIILRNSKISKIQKDVFRVTGKATRKKRKPTKVKSGYKR